jgi:cell division protein FtsW
MEHERETFFNRPVNLYYMLVGSTALLSILGLVMVFSASSIYSLENKGTMYAIVIRQVIFLAICIPMTWVLSRFTLDRWKFIAQYGVIISFALLLTVKIPHLGKSVNGNNNWLNLGFIDVQPSELAKFFMILWAGFVLAKRERNGNLQINVVKLITPAFFICIVLIMLGDDLGTASVFAFIFVGLLWVSGIGYALFLLIVTVGFAAVASSVVTSSYRLKRFSVFLNPFASDQYKNFGWQPAHSLLGIASGGFFGVGLGASRQKWGNLSQAHTDFIFAVIGEELGLFGTVATLLLISILIFSIFKIALRTVDPMVRYVCCGIGCWIGIQSTLNIGTALSVLPVVGVTLPLVSYGGSALVSTFIGIGFVIGAARRDAAIYGELQKSGWSWLR